MYACITVFVCVHVCMNACMMAVYAFLLTLEGTPQLPKRSQR